MTTDRLEDMTVNAVIARYADAVGTFAEFGIDACCGGQRTVRDAAASLLWLGLGVSLGLVMAIVPAWTRYRTAHLHVNLLGFVAMMIFGVAYHVMPRFSGNPLHHRGLAVAHFWLANVGLSLLAVGFVAWTHVGAQAWPVLVAGGVGSVAGAYAFIYNIWRTLDGRRRPRDLPVMREAA